MIDKISGIKIFICLTFLFSFLPVLANSPQDSLREFNSNAIKQYVKENIHDKNIIYTIVPRGVIISVPTIELFDEGREEIRDNAKNFLLNLGAIIKYVGKPCVVEGNALTQKDSDAISNLELSVMRADRIVEFFINETGVLPNMIRGIGFGNMAPFVDNVSYKEHLNKRIDFVILNYEWSR